MQEEPGVLAEESPNSGETTDLFAQPGVRLVDEVESDQDFEVLLSDMPERASLAQIFRSDALYLPDAVGVYRKPIVAIHSVPEKRDAALKLSARKLMEALPLAVQLDLRARGKVAAQALVRKIREDRATPLFEIRTTELGRLAGLSVSNVERIHDTLAELVGFTFIWNVLGEDNQVAYEAVAPFLIRRDRGRGARQGYTRFAFEPEVLLWFLEPKMWANLTWAVMSGIGRDSGLGQEAAFGLYQSTWRYIGTSAKLTPALDVHTWIDLIIGPSRFVQVDARGNKKVVDYKDFKRRYLVPGLAILNGLKALNHTLELREEKSGRKVVRLRFKFNPKVQGVFELPLGWPPETLKLLSELGYQDEEVSTLSQLYPYAQVAEALKRLPEAEARIRAKGSKVYSRKAFFNGILGNIAKGEVLSEQEESRLLKEAEQREKKANEARRMDALQQKFAMHQRGLITAALRDLPVAEQEALFTAHQTVRPADKAMARLGVMGTGYQVLFCRWVLDERPDLVAQWLPDSHDVDFQSWLAWQLTKPGLDRAEIVGST